MTSVIGNSVIKDVLISEWLFRKKHSAVEMMMRSALALLSSSNLQFAFIF